MSRTIEAIERQLTARTGHAVPPVRPGLPPTAAADFIAEWQQRGPETFSGYAVRKLRLAFAPTQSVITASAAG